MIRLTLFAVLSVPIVWISRRSLRHPASHGFSRFFAFEAVLATILLNIPHWFRQPFRPQQLVSWILLCASLVYVVWGFLLLRRLGGFRPSAEIAPDFEWEKTGRLVTAGIYRWIRHPMYGSLLLLAWGVVLKAVTVGSFALGVAATLALFATAKVEEAENVRRFGEEYIEYMKRTRRFVPLVM